MATGKRPPSGSSGGRRRPPTIELEATEVARGPAPPEPPREAAAQENKIDVSPVVEPLAEPVRAAPPPPELPDRPAEPPRGPPPGVGRTGIAWLPPDVPWRLIGAGATGAAAVLLLFLLLGAIGLLPRSQDAMVAVAPKLTAIETQLRELATRPPPAGIDTKAIDELAARLAKTETEVTARLAKLETAVAAPRAPVTDTALLDRLTATDDAVKALAANVAQLARRTDAIAASLADLQSAARAPAADRGELATLTNRIAALERSNQAIRDELANRVAALERSSQSIRDEVAKRVVPSSSDSAVRLAMLASGLRGAVERGDPFAAELAAVKPLTPQGATLAALEPFAAKGVPSGAALGRELAGLVEPMRAAAGAAPRDSGFIERLQANAQKLVRVRPIDEIPGDDATAVLARIEARAAQADIGGALTELAKLPAAARAPAQDWIAKAQARQAAVAAANRIAADALAALKTTP